MLKYYIQIGRRATDEQNIKKKFKVATIFLAYDNRRLLNLMKKRGKYLSQAEHNEAIRVDRQIMKYMDDPEFKERYVRPVTAFVTFVDQEDQALFLELFAT